MDREVPRVMMIYDIMDKPGMLVNFGMDVQKIVMTVFWEGCCVTILSATN